MKLALALDLSLQTVEEITFKLEYFSAAKAGHVQVIALRAALVKVLFSLEVHEIEFVDESVALEQFQRAIDGHAVDFGIEIASFTEQLTGIEMLLGGFDHAENDAALPGHANAAGHEFGLQAAGLFGLRQRRSCYPVATTF